MFAGVNVIIGFNTGMIKVIEVTTQKVINQLNVVPVDKEKAAGNGRIISEAWLKRSVIKLALHPNNDNLLALYEDGVVLYMNSRGLMLQTRLLD